MIKNLLPIIILIASISCDDAIDIIQPGELTVDAVFTNVDDLQGGLNDVYFGLNTEQAIRMSSFFTDETAPGIENSGQNLGLYRFIFNSGSAIPRDLWLNNYGTVNDINRVLEAAAKLEVNDEERAKYENILAQLYTIRAAEHFELLTYFSTDLTDDNKPGVMKLDFVPGIKDELPRSTNGEIFTFIESDLSMARSMIDQSASDPYFITIGFIDALEARMALFRGKNGLAMTQAQKLIDNYPLASRTEYIGLFRDQSTTGVIFNGERNQSNQSVNSQFGNVQIGLNYYFREPNISGGAFMEIARGLFNRLNPGDIRYDVMLQSTSEVDVNYQSNKGENDILLIGKYPGSDGRPLINDYKYFRVAEMYLIKAEAQVKTMDLTGAATTLKELRDARFTAPTTLEVYANETEAIAAVLDERRIELAFEGHRYIDLKRLSGLARKSIDRDPIECEPLSACGLGADEFYKFTFPIPQNEFSGNTVIRDQQNPGYQ